VLPLLTKVDPSPSLDVYGEDRLSSLSSLCIQKPENRPVPGMDIAQTKKYALQKVRPQVLTFCRKPTRRRSWDNDIRPKSIIPTDIFPTDAQPLGIQAYLYYP